MSPAHRLTALKIIKRYKVNEATIRSYYGTCRKYSRKRRIVKTDQSNIVLEVFDYADSYFIFVRDLAKEAKDDSEQVVGMVELDTMADIPDLPGFTFVTPHVSLLPAYVGQGVGKSLYTWILQSGLCLISGDRQSQAANRLWKALSTRYEWAVYDVPETCLLEPTPKSARDPHARLIVLGKGHTVEQLERALAQHKRSKVRGKALPGEQDALGETPLLEDQPDNLDTLPPSREGFEDLLVEPVPVLRPAMVPAIQPAGPGFSLDDPNIPEDPEDWSTLDEDGDGIVDDSEPEELTEPDEEDEHDAEEEKNEVE